MNVSSKLYDKLKWNDWVQNGAAIDIVINQDDLDQLNANCMLYYNFQDVIFDNCTFKIPFVDCNFESAKFLIRVF